MSIDTLPPNQLSDGRDVARGKRRPKRPSITAMIKAAKAAGLEISAIECDESGVKVVCGARVVAATCDDDELDRRMTEQMGVARMGRARR